MSSECSDDIEERGGQPEPRQAAQPAEEKPLTPGRAKIRSWLDKSLRIIMTDKRTLIGDFLCTDRAGNIILGCCFEYSQSGEERFLGSVMVPGHHIQRMEVDMAKKPAAPSPPSTARTEQTFD